MEVNSTFSEFLHDIAVQLCQITCKTYDELQLGVGYGLARDRNEKLLVE